MQYGADPGVEAADDVRPGRRLLPPGPRRGHAARNRATGSRSGSRAAAARATSFTYQAVSDTGNKVLVVAAEDYTGASPVQTTAPAHTRPTTPTRSPPTGSTPTSTTSTPGPIAPDALGVLSHYEAVIWYTGDDTVTRTAGRAGGNADRLAMDEMLEFRAYLNEGGRVAAHRRPRRRAVHGQRRHPALRPEGRHRLRPLPAGADPRRCLPLGSAPATARSTTCCSTGSAATCSATTGSTSDGDAFDVLGVDDPFTGLSWGLNGADAPATRRGSRRSSPPAASCRPTSSRSSRAGRRRNRTGPAGRSPRTPATTTSTRRSPTSPTSG